jgi:3-methyladenine DNA glycosylase Tag
MIHFNAIYQDAIEQHGSKKAVDEILHSRVYSATDEEIKATPDDRYLSMISLRIFRSGLKHSLVDAKWPAFEAAFHQFNILGNAHLSDEAIAEHMTNTDLIRHLGKMKAIRANAQMIHHIQQEHGSFGAFLANWPVEDIIGLWDYFKKHGQQLGGNSGSYFLRMAGKDTFIFTNDVVAALVARKVLDKKPTAKRDLKIAQEQFNLLKEESGWPFAKLSMLLALTVG